MNLNTLFEQLIAKRDLSAEQMHEIMQACMSQQLTDGQITAFLALMRMKGESVEELTAAAQVLLQLTHCIDLGDELVDIVGTGGDGKNTFNISTVSSLVAAAAGVRIAKHGNYSVTSRSGSANLLQQAGLSLTLSIDELRTCLQKAGVCFLFAPHFHPALQHVRAARQQLGIRSLFNLIGPLINPARVKRQVIGVSSPTLLQPIAQILATLGSERCLVVHSEDGLDEFSISAVTQVVEFNKPLRKLVEENELQEDVGRRTERYQLVHEDSSTASTKQGTSSAECSKKSNQGQYQTWSLDPRDFGCYHANLDAIIVDSPEQSLQLMNSVLAGEPGPARDIVLLNSAAAIYVAGRCQNMKTAIQYAAQAIDNGKAKQCLEQLKQSSNHD